MVDDRILYLAISMREVIHVVRIISVVVMLSSMQNWLIVMVE